MSAFTRLLSLVGTLEPPPGEHLVSVSVVAVNGHAYGRICTEDQLGFINQADLQADLDSDDLPQMRGAA